LPQRPSYPGANHTRWQTSFSTIPMR
jgi:hypothetical protein